MTELLNCPFCGGTDLSIETNSVQPDNYHDAWVRCGECDAEGRHAMTLEGWLSSKAEAKSEAIVAWNRRATHASQQGEEDARDAARYRWLRNKATCEQGRAPMVFNCRVGDSIGWTDALTGFNLDSVLDVFIDAARAAHPGKEEGGKA